MRKLNSSTIDEVGAGAMKDGGTERIGVEHQGIPGHPVSGNHHLAQSHCMKIQWKWIDTCHEGRRWVGQNSRKATKGENTIDCSGCHRNQHGTKVKPYRLPGAPRPR